MDLSTQVQVFFFGCACFMVGAFAGGVVNVTRNDSIRHLKRKVSELTRTINELRAASGISSSKE